MTEVVLHNFCSLANCADGETPYAGVIRDSDGNLYGTTVYGGANGGGVVYRVDTSRHETVLYSFCSLANCADGEEPCAGVIRDSEGNLYGATEYGGANGFGAVYKVAPPATRRCYTAFARWRTAPMASDPWPV
jgi:uncharacterized repeat protein (TIGR03803 family)